MYINVRITNMARKTFEYSKVHNGFQHTSSSMQMRFNGHATYDPIASPTNVASEISSGNGNGVSLSISISIDTFKNPEGSGLW